MKLRKLIIALELLAQENDDKESNRSHFLINNKAEIFDNVIEFIRTAYYLASIPNLESRIQILERIDTSALIELITLIEKSNDDMISNTTESPRSDSYTDISALKNSILDISGKEAQHKTEVSFNLELTWENDFLMLMAAFDSNSRVFKSLQQMLVAKLKYISDDQMVLAWANLLEKYSTNESQERFPHYEIIPEDFFSTQINIEEMRKRYADFIGRYKPLILQKSLSLRVEMFPIGETAGIAKVLAINPDGNFPKTLSNIESQIIRIMPRLLAIAAKITIKTPEELAMATGTKFFVENSEYKKYKDLPRETSTLLNLLLSSMKRLTEYVEIYAVDKTSEIEKHLWAFKLGQEIMSEPEREHPSKDINELHLQKRLSKFLIERGILSYGRQFARNEIDLYVQDFGEPFYIEVKLYKEKMSKTKLIKNVSQTISYRDQLRLDGENLYAYMNESGMARGILLLFNYSDHCIDAPRKWIRERIWVLVVNLGATPSKKKGTICITESSDPEKLFDFMTA